MRFLANEKFPLASTKYLRQNGHEVIAIGSDFAGFTDIEVIDLANKNQLTILTFDADYGTLIFKNGLRPQKGVIFLRLFEFLPIEPGQIVQQILVSQVLSFDNTFTVVDKNGIRQRKY